MKAIPQGWTVRGEVPLVDAQNAGGDHLELLDEDLLQVSDPTGTTVLDVGWYPAAQASGEFVCKAVDSNDWEAPLEEFRTRDRSDVETWLERWIDDISARLGEPGELVAPLRTVKISVVIGRSMPPSLEPQDAPLTLGDQTARPKLPAANVSLSSVRLRSTEAYAA